VALAIPEAEVMPVMRWGLEKSQNCQRFAPADGRFLASGAKNFICTRDRRIAKRGSVSHSSESGAAIHCAPLGLRMRCLSGTGKGGYTAYWRGLYSDEGSMTPNKVAAAAIATIALALAAAPAGADAKKKYVTRDGRIVSVDRAPTRLTVRPRSFLDPGTETKQLNEHYADYAFPPLYTPFPDQGGIIGFWRAPLPSPIDLPQYNWGNGF
jgi:hypothetical protein